ncbi:sensor histidine kinase [Paenibacillus humicola]|uniref:sensor histidine kinase n=1 Tax=Paenibacillus humicola TaxID=3110540 RepID=UPI00237BA507|nr:sensor histidine kinase [Paenibacillus humicola]
MIGKLYRAHIRNNLFTKLILLFAGITVLSIATLAYLMSYFTSQSIVRSELANQRKAMDSVNNFMDRKYEAVHAMMSDIYRDPQLSDHSSYLLLHSLDDYYSHRLDQYYADGGSLDLLDYFKNRLEDDPGIENILLYSAEKQFLFVFNQQGTARLIQTNAANSYIPDAMALDKQPVSLPNEWVRRAIGGDPDLALFDVSEPVNNNRTYKNIGQLHVYFHSDAIAGAMENYSKDLKGSILVLAADGKVLFDSSGTYYGTTYPYADELQQAEGGGRLQQQAYVTTLTQNQAGYTVVGVAPKSEVAMAYRGLQRTIAIVSSICILFTILVPAFVVRNYAKRTGNIIRLMRKVETGDMTVRIQDGKEDELGEISRSFNEMIGELNRHIDRVYKAEIRQKHTEFSALQARINPHFLYNTLEVIRMRALSQGARDAGEMIYSLSVLFKNIVQDKQVYTLRDELEACGLYLKLFQIRYKEKFAYRIDWDEQLAGTKALKMSLQPLIENYIVHALRPDRDDNWIEIRVRRSEGHILVAVEDNGTGIKPDKLDKIRQSLSLPAAAEGSFGLRSVHERLKLLYGGGYGLSIDSVYGKGTIVQFRYPAEGGGEGHV